MRGGGCAAKSSQLLVAARPARQVGGEGDEQITTRIITINAYEWRQHLAGLCIETWARVQPQDIGRYRRLVANVE